MGSVTGLTWFLLGVAATVATYGAFRAIGYLMFQSLRKSNARRLHAIARSLEGRA